MGKHQDSILQELSICDEPMVISVAPDEDRDDQNSLLKELIKLIKGDEPCSSPVPSKIPDIIDVLEADVFLLKQMIVVNLCCMLPCGITYISMGKI